MNVDQGSMDETPFDRWTRLCGAALDRRAGVRAVMTLALAAMSQVTRFEGSAAGAPHAAARRGPCGNGGARANRCRRHGQCCTGYCHRKRRCRCRKQGQSCTADRNCCPTSTGRTCQDGACQPPGTCAELGQACGASSPCCAGLTCDDGDDVCVEESTCAGQGDPCGGATPCCAPFTCQGGRCRSTPPCRGQGADCASNADCCASLTCQDASGTCQATVNCEEALNDGGCSFDVDFAAWDCDGADLRGADLNGCDLSFACFCGAHLSNANLAGADLANTDFADATMTGARLTGVSAEGTFFAFATLTGADLRRASLVYAFLGDASLRNANFSASDVTDAFWDGAICPDNTVAGDAETCCGHFNGNDPAAGCVG